MADLIANNDDTLGEDRVVKHDSDGDDNYDPKREKAKRGRKKHLGNKKSRMFKGKPKTREKPTPPDHLFKLPAEIPNRIYSYVLDPKTWYLVRSGTIAPRTSRESGLARHDYIERAPEWDFTDEGPKEIEIGDDNEPALLWVCPQVREEALVVYYNLSSFTLNVNLHQLGSLEKWISSIRSRFDCHDNNAFGSLTISMKILQWSQLGSLLPLASIVHVHGNCLEDCQVWSQGRKSHHLASAFQEVLELGDKAAEEEWHEEWLGFKFEEWLEIKLDSAAARRRTGLANVKGMDIRLPGDWYGTHEPGADDFDVAEFARGKRSHVGTSDRQLRPKKVLEAPT